MNDRARVAHVAPPTALDKLLASLAEAPWAHDFHALLRRLDALHPDAPRFGRALRPSQEAIRLGQDAELDFAPAALSSFDAGGRVPRLGVRFFGLLGPQGPMPLHLTEYVRERQRYRNDPTAARFLDVFHHRLLALFYRAWADTQPTVQHDRPGDDRFQAWLGAAAGLAGAPTGAVPREAQLHQTGLLASRSRHAEGLAKLLSQAFAVPVRIEQNVPARLPIEPEDRSRLGRHPSARLGRTTTAGRTVPDRQSTFRVVLGPLTLPTYLAFLPGGAAWPMLRDWIRQYAGLGLRWDVALCLAAAELPEPRLGRRVRLGVTAWLGRRGANDRRDLRLRPATSFLLRRPGATVHA